MTILHVFGPVSNEVQEQYLWIEGSRKLRVCTFLNQFQMKSRNSGGSRKMVLRAHALQSVRSPTLANVFNRTRSAGRPRSENPV